MPDAALDAEADAAPDNEPATDPHRGVSAGSRSARLSPPSRGRFLRRSFWSPRTKERKRVLLPSFKRANMASRRASRNKPRPWDSGVRPAPASRSSPPS